MNYKQTLYNLDLNIRPAVSTRKLRSIAASFYYTSDVCGMAGAPHCNPSTREVESGEPRAQAHLDYMRPSQKPKVNEKNHQPQS